MLLLEGKVDLIQLLHIIMIGIMSEVKLRIVTNKRRNDFLAFIDAKKNQKRKDMNLMIVMVMTSLHQVAKISLVLMSL